MILLEDTNVTAKQLDRTLHQLTYSKNFHPKAVIFGQFYAMGAAESEKHLYRQVIKDFAGRVSYPVYYYPVFGHGETNRPFILARRAEILCRTGYLLCSLTQAPVVSGFSDTPSPSPGVR
nr:hypothetical protein [Erwinia sp. B116]